MRYEMNSESEAYKTDSYLCHDTRLLAFHLVSGEPWWARNGMLDRFRDRTRR
jgi:hypothetical protein